MPTTRSPILRRAAVVITLGLAATAGGAALAAPATAAVSDHLSYTCSSPELGTFETTAVHGTAPEDRLRRARLAAADVVDVVYGGSPKVSTAVRLPSTVVRGLNGNGVTALDGDAATRTTLAGATIRARQGIGKTFVPETGGMTLVADGYLYIERAGVTAGNTVDLAIASGYDAAFTAELFTYDGDTRSTSSSLLSCYLAEGQDRGLGKLAVEKAQVDEYGSTRYAARSGKVVTTVGYSGVYSTATPRGQVTFVLKRNGERIGRVTSPLEGGRAVARIAAPRSGTYTLVRRYEGSRNFYGSTGTIRGITF